ncbi:MAG: HDOD domain-containing protein [Thiomicrospira sp.]|uniref:HDOD domain-containing protein n=1 Tax=Thiomicrospira sp. TaxID=935 RepID=UPI0019E59556|nr:HDOD domain-containing protein [Thiomicrospira sp.]MBE0493522.1 HDOD domain-containing protein [Thiomicrospira sp.]
MIDEAAMREGITKASLILKTLEVETVPVEILQLHVLISGDSPSIADIEAVISRNPEVMGSFLSMANQALNRPVDDLILNVAAAIHLLGLEEIHQLFVLSHVLKIVPVSQTDQTILKRCMRAGIASAELTHWIYGLSRSEAFLISYMQDIGALYMMRHDPLNYRDQVFNQQQAFPISKYQDEVDYYKTSHCYVGGLITKRWNLGSLLYRSVLFHHHADLKSLAVIDDLTSKMVALNRIANFLVFDRFSDYYFTKELEDSFDEACAFVGVTDHMLHAADAALEKWADAESLPEASH